jgi:phage major head subunit gpT-like protein
MSVTIKAAINRIYQEFRTEALKEFDAAPRLWREFAMEVPSSARSTLHAWLANQATVREWLGPRIANDMSTRTWEVLNKKWELTYKFNRDQIDDDLSGLVAGAIMEARQSGEKFARHEDLLIAQTLEAGLAALCFDGQFFFDTDHPVDVDGVVSGTFSNKLTSSALNFVNFEVAWTRLKDFKNADGSPMVTPGTRLILMVPTALTLKAKQIVEQPYITPATAFGLSTTTGASPNPFAGSAMVLENPYLSSTTRWFLIAAGGLMKPLMLQRRRPLEMKEIGTDSELYFQQEQIQIGSDARYAASYTLPQLAICADA